MSFYKEFLKTLLGWFIAIFLIVLIVFIPREFSFDSNNYEIIPTYSFSLELFKSNISSYLHLVFVEGSFGMNRFGVPVIDDLKVHGLRSIIIISIAFFISLIIGVLKGFFDYIVKDRSWRIFGNGTSFFFQSLPDFFIVIVFQMVLLFLISIGFPHIKIYGVESWHNFLIAGCLLAIYPTVYMARIVFAALVKEEGLPYLLTVKSKGISNIALLWKHQFGNSIYQVFPHIPTIMLYVLSNLLIIEYLMYFRGVGLRLYEALGFAGANIVNGVNRSPFSNNVFEPEVVIAISAMFITLVAIVQLICKAIIYYSPLSKGGNGNE